MTEAELKEKARQERNRYYREYRAKNKERVKAATARSWAKKAVERENNMPRKTDITKDVQSTTAVLQAACEYTGLTEQAAKITQHDPKEQNNRAADDIELLKQACFDFALRVLKGENVQPQETAVLPEVLSFLERN